MGRPQPITRAEGPNLKLAERSGEPAAHPVLAYARELIEAEGRAVLSLAARLDEGFTQALELLLQCQGRVVVTGMGKSGLVGQKISATLASTGTPSLFLHAADAAHGDLGRITDVDVVVALSNSGESAEIVQLVRPVQALGARVLAITGDALSRLGQAADVVLALGDIVEACPMGLVPTASTTAMMVIGDALAVCLFRSRGFGPEQFARYHPGGALGRRLMKVSEVMRRESANPVVTQGSVLREAIAVMTQTPGRPGAAAVVDESGRLVGFFTDGDLRRLLERPDFRIDAPMADVMQRQFKSVTPHHLVHQAAQVLRDNHIDQVPVVDDAGRPVGLLDIQDLLSARAL